MSKIIYKYPLDWGYITVVRLPFRSQVLSIDYDPNVTMCLWAIHDTEDEKDRWVEYEVMVLPTGSPCNEPLEVLGETPENGFTYFKTIVIREYVWHIFMRMKTELNDVV